MTERPCHDIFISYRRDGGFETANLIHDRLSRRGYRVFMDVESLRSGKFNEQLYQVIDTVKDVVVILSPNALDRCTNEGDWLRLEIARALAQKRNVVPVMLRNFHWPDTLPSDIDELRLHNGVEASQELFNAFIERLRTLLHARRRWTFNRLWRPVAFALIPVACALGVVGFFHFRQQARLEQVCKEVVSIMGLEFGKMNSHLGAMEQAEKAWMSFADSMDAAPPREQPKLVEAFCRLLDHQRRALDAPNNKWPLPPEAERLLEEKGLPTQDMKVFFNMDHRMEANKFLDHLEMWAKTPHQGWPPSTREVVKLQAESYREMMVGTYYAFLELQARMPKGSREAFLLIKAQLTRFPVADANWGAAELKALQDRSWQRAQDLEHQCALIVGKDARVIQELQNQAAALASKIAPGGVANQIRAQIEADTLPTANLSPELKAKAEKVMSMSKELQTKRADLQDKRTMLEDTYRRLLEKNTLQENDMQGLMWGKILRVARLGKDALGREHNSIPPERIFSDVKERLNQYKKFQSPKDPETSRYVAAAIRYYSAVTAKKLMPQGILVMGTQNGQPHPVLQTGDIVLERKGRPVKCFEDYMAMKNDPAPNVLKFVRFDAKGNPQTLTQQAPASAVAVGFFELWEN